MKTAIIAIARNENPYIREWAEHHLGVGFDKIIICDNGFGDEERPKDALKGMDGVVDIFDWRDVPHPQKRAYAETYFKVSLDYDWVAFFDIDEFLFIENGGKVLNFISKFPKDCKLISVNWETMTDNGLLRYDGRGVMERFTTPMERGKCVSYGFAENMHTKPMVRGGLGKIEFPGNIHTIKTDSGSYHSNIRQEAPSPFHKIDYSNARLRHFATKTFEEWCANKVPKGRVDNGGSLEVVKFFKYNKMTNRKVEIMKSYFPNVEIPHEVR